MWRTISCLAACWAGIGTAQAQSASSFDWSGFHVSALVGATRGESDAPLTSVTPNYFGGGDFAQLPRDGSMDLSDWRGTGSLQGGYSRQFGNVVLGLDASADALFIDLEETAKFRTLTGATPMVSIRQEINADWMAALRPRLGWAQDSWHVYAMGGPALTRLKVTTSYDDDYDTIGGHGRSTTSKMKLGWAVGLGAEYALDQSWALNMQFLYTDFGSVKTRTHVTHAAHVETSDVYSKANLNTASILVGLSYRF